MVTTIDSLIKDLQSLKAHLGGDTPCVMTGDHEDIFHPVGTFSDDGSDEIFTKHVHLLPCVDHEADIWKDGE